MNTPVPFEIESLRAIVAERKAMPGAMLPILHAIQHAFGHIPADAVPLIAQELNLSRAEVHGVITYYPHFRQQAPGRHTVRVCRAEACQAVGGQALAAHASRALGCDFQETTPDGIFTLEPVYCLGQCACGPALMIDDDVYARVSIDKFDALMAARRGRS